MAINIAQRGKTHTRTAPASVVSELLPPGLLGRWLKQWWGIWQHRFIDAREFARHARDLGIDFWDDHVEELWGLGLLRADLVTSTRRLAHCGFVALGRTPDGRYLYADERRPRRRVRGWGGATKGLALRPIPGEPWRRRSKMLRVLFHPYRYYVLYHLSRFFDLPIALGQPLHSLDGFRKLVEDHLDYFQRFTGTARFLDDVAHWSAVAELAIAAEPCASPRITGWISHQSDETILSHRRRVARYGKVLSRQFIRIGRERLENVRKELCWHEERVDANRNLHTLIRLSMRSNRLKPQGRLGGAVLLRVMAESIRRVSEEALEVELPEEDEVGSSAYYRNAKVELYGAQRLLDDVEAANSFLTQQCFKSGRQVHWYVEGDTEFGGLDRVLGQRQGIVIVNLRGQFAAKRGKGVGFQEDLANDLRTKVFSLVSFDGDVHENFRALGVSLKRGRFFGRVYLSNPCFELTNFSMKELGRVLWQMASDNHAPSDLRQRLISALDGASGVDDLLRRAREALPDHLGRAKKDATWGEYLVNYALAHPKLSAGLKRGEKRPVVDAIEFAERAITCDYGTTFRLNQVEAQYDIKGVLAGVRLVRKGAPKSTR